MRSIYLCHQGVKASIEGERLIIKGEDVEAYELHLHKIDTILAFGNINFTAPAIGKILDRNIITSFFTINGRFKGLASPIKSKNIEIRLNQYELYNNTAYCVQFAKNIVEAKIHNQIAVTRRYMYNHPDIKLSNIISDMANNFSKVKNCNKISSLLGIEGLTTRIYFKAFSQMLRNEIVFKKRYKHPSIDPANALLSFGYTLLAREINGYIETVGLEPYLGFYHQVKYGRLSLTYDLLEPFRQPVIDRFVLLLANKKLLQPDDFINTSEGMRLKNKPLKIFLKQYEQWMNRKFGKNKDLFFRKIIFHHCAKFQKSIANKTEYVPFTFK